MKKKLKSTKYKLLFIVFIIFMLFGFWLHSSKPRDENTTPSTLLKQLLSCPPGEDKQSYKCTVPYALNYIKKGNDLVSFFALLEDKSEKDSNVNSYCHSIGHSVGHALYQAEGNIKALDQCQAVCADGCTMGVMEEMLSIDSHPTTGLILEKTNKSCEEFANGDPVKKSACIHGAGHGLIALVNYDTQKGLDLCKKMQKLDRGSCYDAIFMEKFLPTDPNRKIQKTENMYDHCKKYDSDAEQKTKCMGYLPYAWREWGLDSNKIFKLCNNAQVDQEGCGRALSRLYINEYVISNNLTYFKFYEMASPQLKSEMLRFGVIQLVEYLPSKAHDFCKRVGEAEQECKKQIKYTAQSMGIETP